MAITPKTIIRNPILLALLSLAFLATASFVCSSGGTCRTNARTDVARVHVASANLTAATEAREVPPTIRSAERGWLGVHIRTLTAKHARTAGVKVNRGVLVLDLQGSMPAQNAGFTSKDVITHFAGKPVTTSCQLVQRVQATAPGTRVPVRVNRNGVALTLFPTLTESKVPASDCGSRSSRCK